MQRNDTPGVNRHPALDSGSSEPSPIESRNNAPQPGPTPDLAHGPEATRGRSWIAFAGDQRVAEGDPAEVATALRLWLDDHTAAQPLVFDAETSSVVELDLRGSAAEVRARVTSRPGVGEYASSVVTETGPGTETGTGTGPGTGAGAVEDSGPEQPRGRGRPRLGVVPREVTLLPRHWAWLADQPGGASVALRKLVERALREHRDADRLRAGQESVFRFANAMAGNAPGFEDAVRALFAGDGAAFSRHSANWPPDVRAHALRLSVRAFAGPHSATAGDHHE